MYINNLTPDAIYRFKIRSNCESIDWSAYLDLDLYYHDLAKSSLRLAEDEIKTKIYPNPIKNTLNFDFSPSIKSDILHIFITNNLGEVSYSIKHNQDNNTIVICLMAIIF